MPSIDGSDVRKLVVACDAGMGSSVMLASTLRGQLKKQNVTVEHTPVNSIPADADVVVVPRGSGRPGRGSRARTSRSSPFQVFLGDPAVTKVVNAVKNGGGSMADEAARARWPSCSTSRRSTSTQRADSKEARSAHAGRRWSTSGAVEPAYVDAMLERERSISTYVGEGVAIPHGTLAGKEAVVRDALCFLRFPEPVDWDGDEVTVCVGIAAAGRRPRRDARRSSRRS